MKDPNDIICRCCNRQTTALEGLRHLIAMLERQEAEHKEAEERRKAKALPQS